MKSTPEVWPVIHLRNARTSILNAGIAQDCGASGVFLISMHGHDDSLASHRAALKREFPDLKVGANYLTKGSGASIQRSLKEGFDATWSDYDWDDVPFCDPRPFFAPVAFKGQTYNNPNPGEDAREAVLRGFIPMTSGSGTGVSAPIYKIEKLREAIGPDAPLAMSGVDVKRLNILAELVTHFLIATCISKDFYEFDRAMLRDFMSRV
jgi:hypothetical protein